MNVKDDVGWTLLTNESSIDLNAKDIDELTPVMKTYDSIKTRNCSQKYFWFSYPKGPRKRGGKGKSLKSCERELKAS